MGSSNAALNDDSATESDCPATRTDSDSETETDEDLAPSLDSSPFSEGEKVLASHNFHIYPAKVRKVEYYMKEWRYFVHYLGWNKNWDEWVGVDRLMKHTDENIQKQQALNRKQEIDKNRKSVHSLQMKPRSFSVARGKKRKSDSFNKEKSDASLEKLVNLQIPQNLKKQLVDDCDFITHLGKLVKLPRSPNVDTILKKYLDYRSKKDGSRVADSIGEVVKGLQSYFNKALPVMLLYKSERQQYEDMISEDVSPSTVYGAEHLLRLFVKLPEILVHINIEEETLTELQQKFVDFLKFLQKNQTAFFLSTYHVAGVETSTNKGDD